jgi:hypothetical protein
MLKPLSTESWELHSKVTDESAERAFAFLSRHLKLEPKK